MTAVIEVSGLSKRFGRQPALADVRFGVDGPGVCGLLGRNGAGKTTLLRILAAQQFATAGSVRVFGADPFENPEVLNRMCLIQESQPYPDSYTVDDLLAVAAARFPSWDGAFASQLAEAFGLPRGRSRVARFSRGMRAAVGIVIGLASRAPLTMFDEAHLGLDAAGRTLFYEQLLADFSRHPRTVVLSTHLIDEVSHLLERVLVLDQQRLLLDEEAETLAAYAMTVTGPAGQIAAFSDRRRLLHRSELGGKVAATLAGPWDDSLCRQAEARGLQLTPVTLQQLFVYLTDPAERKAGLPS